MSETRRDEKEEKQHEKEEKGRGDPLSGLVWGLIIVWAGLVLLADNLGFFRGLRGADVPVPLSRFEPWSLIFIGAGIVILIESAIRLVAPSYRRPIAGNIIMAVVFLGIGFGNLVGWNVIWPVILIVVGGLILVRALVPRE